MKKIYLLATALAIMTMASCSDNDFVGDQEVQNAKNGAIQFVSNTPSITRASGADAAEALGYKFKVYAVKKVGDDYSNVFAGDPYSVATDYNASTNAYWVWYDASTAGTTTSNTSNWDYVGSAASGDPAAPTYGTDGHKVTLTTAQTIKYWDYAASQYEFVAYSATAGSPTITKYRKDGFTVTGTAEELAGLYVADKLKIERSNNSDRTAKNTYGGIVQFTFRSAATKVRLGIYETIPGYVVQNVKFRPNAEEFVETTERASLSGSFNGTSSSSNGTYDVAYNSVTGIAEFDNTATAESVANYFDFGTFASATTPTPTPLGETSTTPMWASGSADYQSVLPNTDNVSNMILKVDYDLYNSVTKETIHVKGAKAVVPAMYMTWNPNYAYTYLFKISDNTNGTTGTEGTHPEGLFPITFDALTIATTDGLEVGTITTVSTPHITTYQKGSVSATGITYANANGDIYITVNTNGTEADLSVDNTKLYTVASGTTEADLILTSKTKTAVTSGDDVLSILDANKVEQGITFTSGKAAKFTPTASTNYALEFATITTESVTVNETTVTGFYTRSGSTAPYTYTKITTPNTKAAEGTTYYSIVYQYKIIEVGANPVTP